MSFVDLPNIRHRRPDEALEAYVYSQLNTAQLWRDNFDFAFNGNIDSRNTREIGGYLISQTQIASKNGVVGFSSLVSGADDIRIWAGDADQEAAPFRVYESGLMVASNADITGKITANSGQIGGWTITPTKLYGSGMIEGGTILGSSIKTALSGQRVEMDITGLRSHDIIGTMRVGILPSGLYGVSGVEWYSGTGVRKGVIFSDDNNFALVAPEDMLIFSQTGQVKFQGNGVDFSDVAVNMPQKADSFTGLTTIVTVPSGNLVFQNGVLTAVV